MSERIAVVGTGYVGLVAAVGLADFGNHVVGVDKVSSKIALLQQGKSPIYEKAIEEYLERNLSRGRLQFTANMEKAVAESRIIFIAVGTPEGPGGEADLSQVEEAVRAIGRACNEYKVVVLKSTVPVGTCRAMQDLLDREFPACQVDVVSNPEFLREGRAVFDFFCPDRVVIGCESERAEILMRSVYRSRQLENTPFIFCTLETAEMIKYASNAFLATKLSFINQMAELSEKVGADVHQLSKALGMDHRIGPHFLEPGPGYGGSCFPKDTKALVRVGERFGVPVTLVEQVIRVNEEQKERMIGKVERLLGSLDGKIVTLLGVAFKAETDDVRESPAIVLTERLLEKRTRVRVHDPKGLANFSRLFGESVEYYEDEFEALGGADAMVIVTEWNEYRNLDLQRARKCMRNPALVDLRNLIPPKVVLQAGFAYDGVGYCPEE